MWTQTLQKFKQDLGLIVVFCPLCAFRQVLACELSKNNKEAIMPNLPKVEISQLPPEVQITKSYQTLEQPEVQMNKYIQVLKTSALKPELGIDHKQIVEKIIDELSLQNIQLFYIDGREISSKTTFLSKIAEAMKLPDYFGKNWDALDECITDLEWCPAQGYILVYDRPDIFAKADPEQWQIAQEILNSAVKYWQTTNTPMDVFLLYSTADNINP